MAIYILPEQKLGSLTDFIRDTALQSHKAFILACLVTCNLERIGALNFCINLKLSFVILVLSNSIWDKVSTPVFIK